jgi:hypothetical protein
MRQRHQKDWTRRDVGTLEPASTGPLLRRGRDSSPAIGDILGRFIDVGGHEEL